MNLEQLQRQSAELRQKEESLIPVKTREDFWELKRVQEESYRVRELINQMTK